jgi:hypothetical protein
VIYQTYFERTLESRLKKNTRQKMKKIQAKTEEKGQKSENGAKIRGKYWRKNGKK